MDGQVTKAEERQKYIPEAMKRLDSAQTRQKGLLQALRDRLAPVMRAVPEHSDHDSYEPTKVDLADEINEMTVAFEESCSIIEEILNNLEI